MGQVVFLRLTKGPFIRQVQRSLTMTFVSRKRKRVAAVPDEFGAGALSGAISEPVGERSPDDRWCAIREWGRKSATLLLAGSACHEWKVALT